MNEAQISTNEILHIPIGSLAKYEVSKLYSLLSQATKELEQTKRVKQWIESAISLKYQEHVAAKRLRLEKDTGIINLEDNGYKVTSDVTKKVEWDQAKLSKIAATIAVSGGKISDYVESYYTVPENKYNSWSQSVKNMFAPARTLKLGNPTYKLTKLHDEVV